MPAESMRRWTAQDARDLQEEDRPYPRYEVIDGELLVTPAPRRVHQRVMAELFLDLGSYLRGNAEVELWLSPADIQLEPDTVVQPDIFVAPRVHPRADWAETRSLLLAIEVLSPGSLKHDRSIKRRFYQRNRVGQYWIVDPEARQLERWLPDDARPEILTERLEWPAPGAATPLVIDLRALFQRCTEL